MNLMFIEQLLPKRTSLWYYLPFPLMFLLIMILNYAVITVFNLDVAEIMKNQIREKGELRFFAENMVPFVVGLILLFLWVGFAHRQSILSLTTGRLKLDYRRLFFSFFIWTLFVLGASYMSYLAYPNDYVFNFNPQKFWPFLAVAVVLIPIQTSFEEFLFRGYLMQGLGLAAKNRWFPLLVTSLIFGLMHIGNPEVGKMGTFVLTYYIGTGFFLGIITLMDDGLELALGFHAANNLISALLVTSEWTAFQTPSVLKDVSEPKAGFEIIFPVFVVFPALFFVFAKKYNWHNWKGRLTGKIEDRNLKTISINNENHGDTFV